MPLTGPFINIQKIAQRLGDRLIEMQLPLQPLALIEPIQRICASLFGVHFLKGFCPVWMQSYQFAEHGSPTIPNPGSLNRDALAGAEFCFHGSPKALDIRGRSNALSRDFQSSRPPASSGRFDECFHDSILLGRSINACPVGALSLISFGDEGSRRNRPLKIIANAFLGELGQPSFFRTEPSELLLYAAGNSLPQVRGLRASPACHVGPGYWMPLFTLCAFSRGSHIGIQFASPAFWSMVAQRIPLCL